MSDAGSSKESAPAKRVIGRPFQKGISGNPSGRPAALSDFQAQCRGYTAKALQVLENGLSAKEPAIRFAAAKELLDRGWGKATAIVEANGSLTIRVVTGLDREPGE